jgi:hypothetical protein
MAAYVKVSTLKKLLFVEDSDLPQAIFVVEAADEVDRGIYQYIRLDTLPEELREAVRKAVWND